MDPLKDGPEKRGRILRDLDALLEKPLLVLAVVWLLLVVAEAVGHPPPVVAWVGGAIWALFALDVTLRLALAPDKRAWLRQEWLTVASLALPPFRIVRAARLLSVLRPTGAMHGASLVRIVGAVTVSLRALGRGMRRRGVGYAALLTLVVAFAGAGGMYAFEHDAPGTALVDYGAALWWTSMLLTTVGSDYWPHTTEGRFLCLLLAIYGVAVFGYIAGVVASFFVGER
ncbi:MAG: ion channel [Pseudomonadota bacterium]|nr:ion channel [Pseudomonadota bacterium]